MSGMVKKVKVYRYTDSGQEPKFDDFTYLVYDYLRLRDVMRVEISVGIPPKQSQIEHIRALTRYVDNYLKGRN